MSQIGSLTKALHYKIVWLDFDLCAQCIYFRILFSCVNIFPRGGCIEPSRMTLVINGKKMETVFVPERMMLG